MKINHFVVAGVASATVFFVGSAVGAVEPTTVLAAEAVFTRAQASIDNISLLRDGQVLNSNILSLKKGDKVRLDFRISISGDQAAKEALRVFISGEDSRVHFEMFHVQGETSGHFFVTLLEDLAENAPVRFKLDGTSANAAHTISGGGQTTTIVQLPDVGGDALLPLTPLLPSEPVEPEEPTESLPLTPLLPSEPVEPEEPTESLPLTPLLPSEPVEPEEPTESLPLTPLLPSEPVDPDEPTESLPLTPLVPAEVAIRPETPTKPAKKTESTERSSRSETLTSNQKPAVATPTRLPQTGERPSLLVTLGGFSLVVFNLGLIRRLL